jgi:hypothetical protein
MAQYQQIRPKHQRRGWQASPILLLQLFNESRQLLGSAYA